MLLDAKETSNQKNQNSFRGGAGPDWRQLQHPRALLGLSHRCAGGEDVLRLIDSGEIRWAWDIARPGARRPEVRIWRGSLLAYLAREGGEAGAAPLAEQLDLNEVIAAVLPKPPSLTPRMATMRGRELQRRLQCCRTHLAGLIEDGELSCVGPAGAAGDPTVLYQSVFEFLKRRSM